MVAFLVFSRWPSPICRETLRTLAPVDHLRLIDLVTRCVGGGQARGVADGAVDVDCFSAGATNQVVVVVPDSILVKGRRPGGLDTPDDTLLGQYPQGVVHRLSRDGTDLGTHVCGDVVSRAMGPPRNRTQNRQALSRYLDTMFAKDFCWIVTHPAMIGNFWTLSRISINPQYFGFVNG